MITTHYIHNQVTDEVTADVINAAAEEEGEKEEEEGVWAGVRQQVA